MCNPKLSKFQSSLKYRAPMEVIRRFLTWNSNFFFEKADWLKNWLKSTQYKKLSLNALRFTYWNLKSCKLHGKTKHYKSFIDEKLKAQSLMLFVSFFSCDVQDFKSYYVNHKAFGTSFLYWIDFTYKSIEICRPCCLQKTNNSKVCCLTYDCPLNKDVRAMLCLLGFWRVVRQENPALNTP